MKHLLSSAIALAIAFFCAGLAREALASTATCQRQVIRTWDPAKGDWKYSDGGCPATTCDGGAGDTCYSATIIGTNAWYCACALSPANACMATVHYGVNGPDSAYCDNEACPLPNWCPNLWLPPHGPSMTLTCPCVP